MEELIFFAIIVLFSVIDSIARTRRKRQQAQQVPAPSDSGRPGWEWEEDEPSAYNAEPSYDDDVEDEVGPLPGYARPYGSGSDDRPARPKSSEGMIPRDIWEEIAGMARGRLPTQPSPAPRPSAPSPAPVEPKPVRRVERVPARSAGAHRVHRAHLGYGTDPSSRARSEQDGLDPLAVSVSADVSAARRQLSSNSVHALRRAMILQEVLAPPAALRGDRWEE